MHYAFRRFDTCKHVLQVRFAWCTWSTDVAATEVGQIRQRPPSPLDTPGVLTTNIVRLLAGNSPVSDVVMDIQKGGLAGNFAGERGANGDSSDQASLRLAYFDHRAHEGHGQPLPAHQLPAETLASFLS